jgi:hypothetical protein
MSLTRLLLTLAVAAGLTSVSACTSDSSGHTTFASSETDPIRTDPGAGAAAATPANSNLPPPELIDKIRMSATPSDAVAQYSSGIAQGFDPIPLERAYVRKMVAIGLPEMAEAQAQDLTRRAPEEGVPWAVLAFMNARRGQNDTALKQIAIATRYAPDDAFVQRTAGEILAWYDSQPDRTGVSSEAQAAAFQVRERLHQQPAYANTYRAAWDDQHPKDQAFGPATNSSTTPSASPLAEAEPSTQGYYDSGLPPVPPAYDTAPYYTEPYTYGYYGSAYEPWWPTTYSGIWLGYGGFQHLHHYYPYHDYHYHGYHAPLHDIDHHSGNDHDHDHFNGHDHGSSGDPRIHDYRKLGDDPRTRNQNRVGTAGPRTAQQQQQQRQQAQQPPQRRAAQQPQQQQQGSAQPRQQPQQQRQQQQPSGRRAPAQSSRSHDQDRGARYR